MLASGQAVVGMADAGSELAEVLEGCGAVVPHGDVAAFGAAIEALASSSIAIFEMIATPEIQRDIGRIHAGASPSGTITPPLTSDLLLEIAAGRFGG